MTHALLLALSRPTINTYYSRKLSSRLIALVKLVVHDYRWPPRLYLLPCCSWCNACWCNHHIPWEVCSSKSPHLSLSCTHVPLISESTLLNQMFSKGIWLSPYCRFSQKYLFYINVKSVVLMCILGETRCFSFIVSGSTKCMNLFN